MGFYIYNVLFILANISIQVFCVPDTVQLTTTDNNFISMIAGFTARMQCSLYKCDNKNDVLLFNGTEFIASSGLEPSKVVLQRSTTNSGESVSGNPGQCISEDYTLLLKNLTRQDAGVYRCQLINYSQQLDFHLDVLAGFHENYTYDYTECCIEKGISPLCRSMCKPRDMHLEFFDPTRLINLEN